MKFLKDLDLDKDENLYKEYLQQIKQLRSRNAVSFSKGKMSWISSIVKINGHVLGRYKMVLDFNGIDYVNYNGKRIKLFSNVRGYGFPLWKNTKLPHADKNNQLCLGSNTLNPIKNKEKNFISLYDNMNIVIQNIDFDHAETMTHVRHLYLSENDFLKMCSNWHGLCKKCHSVKLDSGTCPCMI